MKKISGWILVCLILLAVSAAAASGTGIDRLPLELDIPETMPAGLDGAIHWAPEVSGQLLEVYFMSNGNETCLGGFSNECDIPVPGHLIAAPGIYHGSAGTYMSDDSIPGSSETFYLEVVYNPNQPASPSVTIGTAHAGQPISLDFDQAYDEVYMVIKRGATFCEEHTWTQLNDVSVTIDEVGDYSFLFTARTGNVWSQVLTENVSVLPTEITVYDTPDSFQIGEAWNVNVLLPGFGGDVFGDLTAQDGRTYCSQSASLLETMSRWTFDMTAEYLIDQGLTAGTYTCTVTWRHDGTEDVKTFPVTITGERPVKPVITDGTFSVGEGDTIRLTGTAGSAEAIRVDWNAQLAVEPWHISGTGSAQIDSNGVWTFEMIPANGGTYRITITGQNGNLSTGNTDFWTYVTQDSSPSAPTYSMEETDSEVTIHLQPGSDLPEGASPFWFVSYKHCDAGRYDFEEMLNSEEDGSFSYTLYKSNYAEQYELTFCYQVNGVFSEPAEVTVHTQGRPYPVNGELPMEYTVPEIWPAGADLSVDWTGIVEGQEMQICLFRMDGEHEQMLHYEFQTGAGTFRAPGYDLEEGNYRLRFYSDVDTYWPTTKDYDFEVVSNPNRPAPPTVEMTPSAPNSMDNRYSFNLGQAYEDIHLSIYAWNTDNAAWESYGNMNSESTNTITYWSRLSTGLWKAEICAAQSGVYSEAAVLEFEVVEAPTLGAIELAQPLPELQINRRFSVTVRPVEHATQYHLILSRDFEGDDGPESRWIGSAWAYPQLGTTENVTLTVSQWEEAAQPGSDYSIQIDCYGPGYQSSSLDINDLTVSAPSQIPAAPTQVQVSTPQGVPLTAEQLQNLVAGCHVPVRVTYPQMMQMVEVKMLQEGETGVTTGVLDLNPSRTTAVLTDQIAAYDAGDYTLQARVMTDDLWSAWSEPVAIHVNSVPEVDPPTMTLEKTEMQLGESLNITFGNIDPRISNIEIGTDIDYNVSFSEPPETLTVTLPEDAFAAGETNIWVSYEGPLVQMGELDATVTVTGTRPAAPQVTFSATSASYGDTIYATVQASGATQVEMEYWGIKEYHPAQNGTAVVPIEIDFFNGISRIYRFRARIGGVWSEWVGSGEIHSLTPRPTMQDAEFAVIPTEIVPGQDLEITFLPVEGITEYYISMEHGWTGFYGTYDEPGTVRIPASCFSDGGTFGFDIGAGVTGSPDLLVETFVLSCAPIAEGTLQPLTVQAVDSEVSYGEPGEISLGSVQAEKAIFQSLVRNTSYAYGDVWQEAGEWSAPAGGSSSVVTFGFGVGTWTLRVSAQVGGVWTDWSNPVTFTMADREAELLHNPVPQIASQIAPGQTAHITWNAAAHAQSYEVYWVGQGSQGSLITTGLFADIPAESLSEGTWTVYIVSHAAGYLNDGYSERVSFTVTTNPEPVQMLRLPADLTTIGPEAFVGVGADAVYIPQGVTSIAADAFDDGITIYGVSGSYAQTYAQTNGLPFVEADE
ncbi:MAG: hypothetical protein IJ210_02405 [Clostridia bacterium]|nr:hypothetical protein [Clostridia bacterium]